MTNTLNYRSSLARGLCLLVMLTLLAAWQPPASQAQRSVRAINGDRSLEGPVYDGRILSFDPVRREITLAEVRQDYPPLRPIPGLPVADQGVTGQSLGAKDNTLTFHVADKATITLRGRPVALGTLRADMVAQVWARPAPRPGDTGIASEVLPGDILTAERIEARMGPVLRHE